MTTAAIAIAIAAVLGAIRLHAVYRQLQRCIKKDPK
jgi:hypothetical protein